MCAKTEPFWSAQVRNQHHFEIARREASQIRTIIADLDRTIQLLDRDIGVHEENAMVSDPANFAYPITARDLAARRDNLKITIAALEQRLSDQSLSGLRFG